MLPFRAVYYIFIQPFALSKKNIKHFVIKERKTVYHEVTMGSA